MRSTYPLRTMFCAFGAQSFVLCFLIKESDMSEDYIAWAGEEYKRFACTLDEEPSEEAFLDYFWVLSAMY